MFQKIGPPADLVSFVQNLAVEFVCCVQNSGPTKVTVIKPIRWELPGNNWFKLNTDGSVRVFPGSAGSGGLICNWHGEWVMGFSRATGITCSTAVERCGLRDRLIMCVQLQLPAIEVDSDAEHIVLMLTNNNTIYGDLSILVDDCRELLKHIPQTKVQHCYREANFYVDALAKLGSSLDQSFVSFCNPPLNLLSLLAYDKQGLFCNQLCSMTNV